MKASEFAAMVQDGIHPIVTFNKDVEILEDYAEPGMRARIIGVVGDHDDDVIKFKVDYAEHDDYNKQFEVANYFDKNEVPCLTAREKGCYKVQDTLYIDANLETPWSVEEPDRLSLYGQYKLYGQGETYVQWLETALLQRMKETGV